MSSAIPFPEYPRPQLVRPTWQNLNGSWDYAIRPLQAKESDPLAVDDPTLPPEIWDGNILVPYSPEVASSGVNRQLQPDHTLWYHRTFTHVREPGRRVLLHFGAVDQSCLVAVNGRIVGGHTGGYLPLTLDITEALGHESTHSLVVAVRDVTDTAWLTRGKQSSHRGGIWYTPQSGIWQTVWIEDVPTIHIESVIFTPTLDSVTVEIQPAGQAATVAIGTDVHHVVTDQATIIPIPEPHLWSPDDPYLYSARITMGDDVVDSYFALRTYVRTEDGSLLLNGQPHLSLGLLDQGYWPHGGYTPPNDEAMEHDIRAAKAMGYNMLRKHIKIEPLRWYYHCDRLGMLVWQDAVNGGRPPRPLLLTTRVVLPYPLPEVGAIQGRQDAEGRISFEAELHAMIDHLRGIPSIVTWVPFNEGWGQFDSRRIASLVKDWDPSRLVDATSGWFDQGGGDFHSIHLYFRPPWAIGRGPVRLDRRILAMTEYGGLSYAVAGHTWSDSSFGYLRYSSAGALGRAFQRLHGFWMRRAIARGLSVLVYTQLSDVEDEDNGLLTYDRQVTKMPPRWVRDINAGLQRAFLRAQRR